MRQVPFSGRVVSPLLLVLHLCCISVLLVTADPTLISLETSIGESQLSPAFTPTTYAYTQSISMSRSSFYAIAVGDCSPTCRIVSSLNGGSETYLSTSPSGQTPIYSLDVSVGFNELVITIISNSSASPNVSYVIDMTRSPVASYNAFLLGFTLRAADGSGAALTPIMTPASFSTKNTSYHLELPQGVSDFAFSPFIDTTASVTLTVIHIPNTSTGASGFTPITTATLRNNDTSPTISIASGEQVQLQVNVTAADGITKLSYDLYVNRFGETNVVGPTSSSSTGSSGNLSEDQSSTGSGNVGPQLSASSPNANLSPLWIAFSIVGFSVLHLAQRAAL